MINHGAVYIQGMVSYPYIIWFGEGQDDQPWCSIHTGDGQLSLCYGLVKGIMACHDKVYIQGVIIYPEM